MKPYSPPRVTTKRDSPVSRLGIGLRGKAQVLCLEAGEDERIDLGAGLGGIADAGNGRGAKRLKGKVAAGRRVDAGRLGGARDTSGKQRARAGRQQDQAFHDQARRGATSAAWGGTECAWERTKRHYRPVFAA